MKYVPELTWLLFLRILDERETQEADEAEALGITFAPSIKKPHRWRDLAAPGCALRLDAKVSVRKFVHEELLPYPQYFGVPSRRPKWLRVDRLLGEWGLPKKG